VIGVVTSPTGAVIRDILHRLADRFRAGCWYGRSGCRATDRPSRVAVAIRGFNALPEADAIPRPDLVIVAPRRRLARGPVVIQRRERRARGGRQHDPADLGGRARDRLSR
jgi:hypothetical protein